MGDVDDRRAWIETGDDLPNAAADFRRWMEIRPSGCLQARYELRL